MKRLVVLLIAGGALAAQAAPATPKAPEAPAAVTAPAPAPDPVKVSAKAIVLLEGLSAAAQKHAGDCDAIGKAMLVQIHAHGETIALLKQATPGGASGKMLQAKYGERATKAIRGFLEPLNACHSNSTVRAALSAL